MSRRSSGFTLIELMIVVAVVAILAAIAYPSYAESVRKGHRGQAKADLLELTQLLERHRTVNRTYDGFDMGGFESSPRTGAEHYEVGLSDADASGYTLTAAPSSAAQRKDARCGALSINQAGTKSIGDSATGSVSDCW